MPWSEVASGKLQRAIGENETFIKLIGDPGLPLGRENWAINVVACFKPTGSLAQEDISALLLRAWIHLRFHHPSIASYPVDEKTLEYAVPDTSSLNEWATETFKISEATTAAEAIPDLKPSPYATVSYFPKSSELLLHTSHWRTDGIGALLLLNAFFDLFTSRNLSDPETLAWGEEVARLAPAVEDAADMPSSPTDAIKALGKENVGTFHQAAGTIGIPYRGDANTLPRGTRSSHLAFSTSETESIVTRCKARGFSVTSALHASVAASNYELALAENKHKHYTSTFRFSLRPYLPDPYSTSAYASGLYTTGWMKTVPASASWTDNAKAYNEEYRVGLSKRYIESHRQYALDLGDLIRHMPQGLEPPSDVDISSIGIAESLIERVKGTPERGLEIESVSVGVEVLTRQAGCFVWTFRDQLNLSVVFNEAFHDEEDMAVFLATLKDILLQELDMER